MRRLATIFAIAVALVGCGTGERVVVGAGTTTVDSGLMRELVARFGDDVSVVAGSTAQILELGAQGAVDVAIVHDEAQELAFLDGRPQVIRRPVFTSRFLLVGPADHVARLSATTPQAAFAEIAANGWPFVTRGDGSGTHSRELAVWEQSGIEPGGDWYLATGQAMGFTLQVADQRSAFTLVEEGAFLAAREALELVVVPLAPGPDLANPYSALLVAERGRSFFEWLTGPAGQAAVAAADRMVFADPVYLPSGEPD